MGGVRGVPWGDMTLTEEDVQNIVNLVIVLIYLLCLGTTIVFYCLAKWILRSSMCDDEREYRTLEGVPHAFYIYRATPSNFYENLGICLNFMTLGLSAPWVTLDQFVFRGLRTRFVGTTGDYVRRVCLLNSLLNYLTLGLWTCCGCAGKAENAWLDNHTRPLHEDEVEEHGFYYFQARPNFCRALFYRTCLFVTCQVAETCVLMCETFDTIGDINVFGRKAHFTGTWSNYWSAVLCPTAILSFVTCGLYTCCGWAEERRDEWFDAHLIVPPSEKESLPTYGAISSPHLLDDRPPPSPIKLEKY